METKRQEFVDFITILPWEDLLFKYIFIKLDLEDLFQLRAVNHSYNDCVNGYFETMPELVITKKKCKFSSDNLDIFACRCRLLKTITLKHGSHYLKDPLVIKLVENNNFLQHVDLSHCSSLTDKSIQRLILKCSESLKDLVLKECHWVSQNLISQIATNCHRLRKLDLTGCWDIQDNNIIFVASLCLDLTFLSVAKIYSLTDSSISVVAKNLQKLQHIDIHGCWRVSDKSVFLLMEYCKHLTSIHVKDCRDVTWTCIYKMVNKGIKVDLYTKKSKAAMPEGLQFLKGLPM